MSVSKQWIGRWIDVLDAQDRAVTEKSLAPDILVLAYHEGVGGPQTRLEGLEAVFHWLTRAPKGCFIFECLTGSIGGDAPELPEGELTIKGQYKVSVVDDDFTNTGEWTLVIRGELIVGVLHEPQPI